jgi:hypothetical protein
VKPTRWAASMIARRRRTRFVVAFVVGCALSSAYGFLAGTWAFGVVEAIWSLIALRRYLSLQSNAKPHHTGTAGSTVIDRTRSESS